MHKWSLLFTLVALTVFSASIDAVSIGHSRATEQDMLIDRDQDAFMRVLMEDTLAPSEDSETSTAQSSSKGFTGGPTLTIPLELGENAVDPQSLPPSTTTPPSIPVVPTTPRPGSSYPSPSQRPSSPFSGRDYSYLPKQYATPPIIKEKRSRGFNLFQKLLDQLQTNMEAETRAMDLKNMEQDLSCSTTLKFINQSIEQKELVLRAANQSLASSQRNLRDAVTDLNTNIRPLIYRKRRQLARLNQTIAEANDRRKLEEHVAYNRTQDAELVIKAVRIVLKLVFNLQDLHPAGALGTPTPPQPPSSSFVQLRFREEMQKVQKQIHDPDVARFVETTLRTLSGATAEATAPPTSEDITKIKLLLNLLKSQLEQHVQSIRSQEEAARQLWVDTRTELLAQMAIVSDEITARRKVARDLLDRIKSANQTIAKSNRTLHGDIVQELSVLRREQRTWLQDCAFKSAVYRNLTGEMQQQMSVVKKLLRIDLIKDDDTFLDRITKFVVVPKPDIVDTAGKRCCHVCKAGRKACGDRCISIEEVCAIPDGCACDTTALGSFYL